MNGAMLTSAAEDPFEGLSPTYSFDGVGFLFPLGTALEGSESLCGRPGGESPALSVPDSVVVDQRRPRGVVDPFSPDNNVMFRTGVAEVTDSNPPCHNVDFRSAPLRGAREGADLEGAMIAPFPPPATSPPPPPPHQFPPQGQYQFDPFGDLEFVSHSPEQPPRHRSQGMQSSPILERYTEFDPRTTQSSRLPSMGFGPNQSDPFEPPVNLSSRTRTVPRRLRISERYAVFDPRDLSASTLEQQGPSELAMSEDARPTQPSFNSQRGVLEAGGAAAAPVDSQRPTWTCPTCTLENDEDYGRCNACDTWKPNFSSSMERNGAVQATSIDALHSRGVLPLGGSVTEARVEPDCVVCMDSPRDAILVHDGDGHHVCCMSCADILSRQGHPCPVCQRPIETILRYFS